MKRRWPTASARVRTALKAVGSLFDDEILRALDNLVKATVRTNAYQRPERPVFSIKVDCAKVEGMVSPRPLFEIYVHSRRLEGIHLRGGKVARGGLRWSDRHDDFRTEILGLMKTQMVKNAIIVPVGAKGGFVLKGEVPTRPALDAYLIDRYREFVSGLLDVTDNIVKGEVVHPPEVVRHDDDDPYLVVAADKGTAHLSDTANQVSGQYGHWLGDAFASGGSNGYDHKKEGITARGAWECVIHHFRKLGVDVQTQPFTMAGIGDMAGDVFGNGALRSKAIKLVAAFNHVHIFIDPSPDPEKSFAERERLFKLPRSTWKDYDASLISAGGGMFDRSAKSIPLSAEARALLGIQEDAASGEEVIRHILTANVDLLYNGGIGTYIKSSAETDTDVGDRANDRVRVDANEVRAQGDRRRRQPRPDAAGAARILGQGRQSEHRRDRQLGRRRHVGPRGQHQDPARRAAARGCDREPQGAQQDPRGDDRRGLRAGARRQPRPGARAHARRPAQRGALRRLPRLHRGHDRERRRQSRRTTTSRRAWSCWRIRRRIAAFRVRCCACCSA